MRLRGVGLLSPCGWGNLGDAAIQEAMIQNVRARQPAATVLGITLNPGDTVRRHGIPAFPIAARPLPGHWLDDGGGQLLAPSAAQPRAAGRAPSSGRGRGALTRVPGYGAMRRLLWPLWAELRHAFRAYRLARGLDLLIVSGGGQLDEAWGGPWAGPWDLFKWSLAARAAGARFVVTSVGAETLDSRLARLFVRSALGVAAYRSYRDEESRRRVAGLGVRAEGLVVPDLAFSLEMRGHPAARPGHAPPAVGVGPIAFGDPRAWPVKDAEAYGRYLDMLAALVRWLVGRHHPVVLFTTSSPDRRSVDDLLQRLGPEAATVRAPRVEGLEDLFAVLRDVDLVVASRLHAALLAIAAERPVLAICHHAKVRALMADVGLGAYSLEIRAATPDALLERFTALAVDAERLLPLIRARVATYRAALQTQYDRLFAPEGAS